MDKEKYDLEEKLTRNTEANKNKKSISDVLFQIDRSCLRPIIFFLKSIPSGFAPLPLHSLTVILEHSENENLKSTIYSEKEIQNEIKNLSNNIWFEVTMNCDTSSMDERVNNIANIINRRQYLNNSFIDITGNNEDKKNNALNLNSIKSNCKLYKTVISLEQMLYIYKLGGINNENVWTALFGIENDNENEFKRKFVMPSFLSNKILIESYSNIMEISEPQHNSLQIYMYCRNMLKYFCTDVITPRILIHANIFLLWNSTLKDIFKNKAYDKVLMDLNNNNSYPLYLSLVNGNLPSLLLLKVLEEEFAKFSVLVHFLLRIFGYLDRSSCHIFSNSPNLSITSLLYFYKCVFFPLSSSFTAALLNIITIERDYFIQTSLRTLSSCKMNDESIFTCIKDEDLFDEIENNFEKLNSKCKVENHFSMNIDNSLNFNIENISGRSYDSILFNVINNIVYIMSNNSNNVVKLRRTDTIELNSELNNIKNLNNNQFQNSLLNSNLEKKLSNWNRISKIIDNCCIDDKSIVSSGLFWFTPEENDLTVYKTTIEEPFLKNTIYYYFNRLEYLFNFLDLKQCCILSNWILIQEEKRIFRIFPHKSHSNFLKLLENIVFHYLSKKIIESHKQSISNFVFINKENEYNGNKHINYNILFKGSIRSYINNDNYCALKSIYLLIMKDSLRSNSYNVLKKILVRNDISSLYKKLEFPIKNLHLDISKLSNSSNNNNSFRQSSMIYFLYAIYESIIEDISKAMKLEIENILTGESNFYIQISDRFVSIQIVLSILKRYLKFAKYSFLNDVNVRKIIYRGIYDGLIIYFQNSMPKNYYFLLFVLSVWINSFIDNRILQLYNLMSEFNKRNCLFSLNYLNKDQISLENINLLNQKTYLSKFVKFSYEWSSIIFEKNSIKYEYIDILRTEMMNIVLNLNSSKYSRNFELFINNIISSIVLLKLFHNTEVIISHYKDRLCKRLLTLNFLGRKLRKDEIRLLSCIMINICMEYYFLINLETIKLVDSELNSLSDELSLNEIFSLINNNDNNNIYDILNGDSTNMSLKSIKSLLDDYMMSLFSNIMDVELLTVFLTNNFNWRKIKKSSTNLNKYYSQVNIPDEIKKEMINFELKYKATYPHRKLDWLWDNGFVTLKAIGFKFETSDDKRKVELSDFEIVTSLSAALVLISIGKSDKDEINIDDLIKQTSLPKIEIVRILISLIIPGQNILRVNNDQIKGIQTDIMSWRSWLNKETHFRLNDINLNNFIFNEKFVLYPKILPKELFVDTELNFNSSETKQDLFMPKYISENYFKSYHFKNLFNQKNLQEKEQIKINKQTEINLPNYDSKICTLRYPWNLDLYIDDKKYEEFFNSMSNFMGSDEIFYSVTYEKKRDQIMYNSDNDFYNNMEINNSFSFDLINSFIYKDNTDILFEENYKLDGSNKLIFNKNYSLNYPINLFGNIIINGEDSSRILLNTVGIGNMMNNDSFIDMRKFPSIEQILNFRLDPESTEKRRCLVHNLDLDSSTMNDLKSKMSSSSSTFSLSSSSSSSLIYMEPINNQLLSGYFTTIVEIICKVESLIIKLLKKSTSQTYIQIINYIKNSWNHNLNDFPSISCINQALVKLIKRDFILFVCNHKNRECICESISQSIFTSNDNTDVSNIFLNDSTFNYIP